MNPQIILRESDVRRLRLLLGARELRKGLDSASLQWLEGELDRASVVPDDEIPSDVVTLHSIVELEDLTDGDVEKYVLVLPAEANPSENRISILAPLGMGMLGYKAGDEFEWPIPTGTARFRVRRVLGTVTERRGGDGTDILGANRPGQALGFVPVEAGFRSRAG